MAREYKYRLLYFLQKLPHGEFFKKRKEIARTLGISERTLMDWCYIKEDDPRMIYADHLYLIAQFFNVDISEMFTKPKTYNHVENSV